MTGITRKCSSEGGSRASCVQVMAQGERSGRSERTVDPQLLKMALAPHPKLRAALFPAGPRGNGPPSDVSVYHLLQVNSPPSAASRVVLHLCVF